MLLGLSGGVDSSVVAALLHKAIGDQLVCVFVEITRQGTRIYRDALDRRIDPRGEQYYWIGGEAPTGVSEPDTDFWAISKGFVSITPLKTDLTADAVIPQLSALNLHLD
ncbi:MAG: hypothetical protein P8Z41_14705 [Anaerolineales bacterium]